MNSSLVIRTTSKPELDHYFLPASLCSILLTFTSFTFTFTSKTTNNTTTIWRPLETQQLPPLASSAWVVPRRTEVSNQQSASEVASRPREHMLWRLEHALESCVIMSSQSTASVGMSCCVICHFLPRDHKFNNTMLTSVTRKRNQPHRWWTSSSVLRYWHISIWCRACLGQAWSWRGWRAL
jgi:hypothetical protein